MKLRCKKGFTLIELLVVIAIIGLLASIAVVAVNSARMDTRNTKRKADISQITKALEIYFNRFGRYPDNSTATGYDQQNFYGIGGYWWDSSCNIDGSNDTFITPLTDLGIMVNIPNDPLSRGSLSTCYNYTSTRFVSGVPVDGYYLYSFLENSQSSENNNCPELITSPALNCYHQGDMQSL
ncbi:MAG: type II secretion system protein [Patescibacteria group bacterium]|jgi:prepilin-type N-terminal cleavage/methylation domain-containing protein